jgi:hypothetical protein
LDVEPHDGRAACEGDHGRRRNPTDEPSNFFAFDFKGKIARFRFCAASPTIGRFFASSITQCILRQDKKDRQRLQHKAFALSMFVFSRRSIQ